MFLGLFSDNCSRNKVCHESESYKNETVNIKLLEFVDAIADPNDGYSRQERVTVSLSQFKSREVDLRCRQM